MADRCKLFHRRFPDKKLNETLLRRVYRIHGVKKKALRWKKRPKANTLKQYGKLKEQLREEINATVVAGFDILWLDECMFTRKTVPLIEWSNKLTNIEVEEETINEPAYALLMAVSDHSGVELAKVYKKSVNIEKFLKYVEELRAKTEGRKIALFMDNLSVHRSKKVLKELDHCGFRYIFNLPYAPTLNPIELCFSKVKQSFKAQRL